MNKNVLIGCCLAALAVVACDGLTSSGTLGSTGAAGSQGPQGSDGAQGPAGQPGADGNAGDAGAQGETGATGDVACGTVSIDSNYYGSACGAGANGLTSGYTPDGSPVCFPGTVQCQFSPDHGLTEVCANENGSWAGISTPASLSSTFPLNQTPLAAGDRCDEDLNCDGTADNTTGAGTNVALVRHALVFACPIQASDGNNVACQGHNGLTFLAGLCRNAATHCLSTDVWCQTQTSDGRVLVSCDGNGRPETGPVSGNREGVTLSDFGDLRTPTADEAKMGTACLAADGITVRSWDCAVDANGVASVTCTGSVVTL